MTQKVDWSFDTLNQKETNYYTHDIHRYPAKFIPQLANNLIQKYSKKFETVLDPMGGCGTTLLEAKLNERVCISIDINPIATLISQVKVNPINPDRLSSNITKFNNIKINRLKTVKELGLDIESIKFWFNTRSISDLQIILNKILLIEDIDIKRFFLCGFSNILKNSSTWLSKSIKPQRDPLKKEVNVSSYFYKQLDHMINKNNILYNFLEKIDALEIPTKIINCDAKQIPLENNSIDLVVTSPPYANSYDYFEIHKLSFYWLVNNIILNSAPKIEIENNYSYIPSDECNYMLKKIKSIPNNNYNKIRKYYLDIFKIILEIKRVLKKHKKVCLVVGNKKYFNFELDNKRYFCDFLEYLGFKKEEIIERKINNKILPSYRNMNNGRFTNSKDPDSIKIYPTEFIIIYKKG